jgi:transcriptional regulator with XRE-family HTH domain
MRMLFFEAMTNRAATAGEIVGAAVRQLRKDRGWTLQTLSHKTDISVSGLSQLESGRITRVRRDNLVRLAAALGVSESELDPRSCGDRVAQEATTLEQRQMVDAILSLPVEDAAEVTRLLAELSSRPRRGSRS